MYQHFNRLPNHVHSYFEIIRHLWKPGSSLSIVARNKRRIAMFSLNAPLKSSVAVLGFAISAGTSE
jgi:hypothetical protein